MSTTIEQIAERAGVSKPTVFAAAGNKGTILKQLHDFALAGDDQPLPVAGRPWYQQALRELSEPGWQATRRILTRTADSADRS